MNNIFSLDNPEIINFLLTELVISIQSFTTQLIALLDVGIIPSDVEKLHLFEFLTKLIDLAAHFR